MNDSSAKAVSLPGLENAIANMAGVNAAVAKAMSLPGLEDAIANMAGVNAAVAKAMSLPGLEDAIANMAGVNAAVAKAMSLPGLEDAIANMAGVNGAVAKPFDSFAGVTVEPPSPVVPSTSESVDDVTIDRGRDVSFIDILRQFIIDADPATKTVVITLVAALCCICSIELNFKYPDMADQLLNVKEIACIWFALAVIVRNGLK